MELEQATRSLTPRISVVIVTYQSVNELPTCLDSLLNQSVPIEILLTDNASTDGTPDIVADYAARFPNVHAILNKTNLGLAAGNNCALGRCRGDYVLILNPDTVLPAESLTCMLDFLETNRDIGVIGPKCVYQDGTPHVSFHRAWGLLHVFLWRIIPYRFVRALYDHFSPYRSQDVLFVSGACLLIRREIFEQIGGYDPEYFLTVEDAVDLCIRAKQTGCRIVFLAEAQIVHHTGRSGNQVPFLVIWQGMRGTVYHFLKHKGKWQALLVSALLGFSAAARVVTAGIFGIFSRRYRGVARSYAFALRDLVFKNPIRVNTATTHTRVTRVSGTSIPANSRAQASPRVHIVLLNWNNYADTAGCILSLKELNYDNFEVIVVDNGSTDDSVANLRSAFPDLNVLQAGRNLGFAGGCNAGIRYALSQECDFVWLLNIDTKVDRDALQTLVQKIRSAPSFGACGSAIYFMDNPETLQAWGGGYVNFLLGRSRHYLRPVPDEFIECITGASMLISRQAIESVGLLDERFFMYWEDTDYCFRLRASGWKLGVAGQSRVLHKGSSSVGKESVKLDRYFNASAARFFRQYAALPFLPIWMSCILRVGKRVLRADWKRAQAVLAGVAAREDDKFDGGASATPLESDRANG